MLNNSSRGAFVDWLDSVVVGQASFKDDTFTDDAGTTWKVCKMLSGNARCNDVLGQYRCVIDDHHFQVGGSKAYTVKNAVRVIRELRRM